MLTPMSHPESGGGFSQTQSSKRSVASSLAVSEQSLCASSVVAAASQLLKSLEMSVMSIVPA